MNETHRFWRGRLVIHGCILLVLIMAVSACRAQQSTGPRVNLPVATINGGTILSPRMLRAAVFIDYSMVLDLEKIEENQIPGVILLLYHDGTVIWSDTPTSHGALLYRTKVDNQKIEKIFSGIKEKGYFGKRWRDQAEVGLDSAFTTVYMRQGSDYLNLRSWNELYDDQWENEELRAVWMDVRSRLGELVPQKGHRIKSDEKIGISGMEWVEGF